MMLAMFFLIVSGGEAYAQAASDFGLTITVSDGQTSKELVIGMDPNASDGIDEFDVLAPPPPPGGDLFYARVEGDDTAFYTDIRRSASEEIAYELSYHPAEGQGPITLSWDNQGLEDIGSFTIVDPDGENIDMTATESFDVSTASSDLSSGLTITVNTTMQDGGDTQDGQDNDDQDSDTGQDDQDGQGNDGQDGQGGQDGQDDQGTGDQDGQGDQGDDGQGSQDDDTGQGIEVVAEDDAAATDENVAVELDVLGNDDLPDADVTIVIVSGPSNGSVSVAEGGTVTYTPDEGFNGEDSFVYEVEAVDGTSDRATVTITVDRVDTAIGENQAIPTEFSLEANYPNPFNPTTVISYAVPEASRIRLTIYNLRGRVVATLVNGMHTPGRYTVTWEADGYPSGIYFYRMQAGNYVQTRKLMLLK